jgi:hypothetical protein
MTLIEKLPAFASGVAAAAIAFTLFTPVSAQVKPDVIVACADAEGAMRLNDGGPCRPGERRLVLKAPDLEDVKPDETPKDDKKVADLDRRLKGLEERNQRGHLLGSRVVAPFEVVNEAGKRVFYVQEGSTSAYNAAGTMVARIVANENGGSFEGRSATAPVTASIGSSGQQMGVVIQENDRQRVQLGRNDKGNYGARIYSATGKLVAGIGQSQAGTGIAMVADAAGTPKAKMYSLPSGAGIVEIINGQGIGVATMSSAGPGGAGLLQLTNASGTVMVEAGVSRSGIGIVRAGPAAFNSGIGFLGLPGSYIEGRPPK